MAQRVLVEVFPENVVRLEKFRVTHDPPPRRTFLLNQLLAEVLRMKLAEQPNGRKTK